MLARFIQAATTTRTDAVATADTSPHQVRLGLARANRLWAWRTLSYTSQ